MLRHARYWALSNYVKQDLVHLVQSIGPIYDVTPTASYPVHEVTQNSIYSVYDVTKSYGVKLAVSNSSLAYILITIESI